MESTNPGFAGEMRLPFPSDMRMWTRLFALSLFVLSFLFVSPPAQAASGTFKFKSTEVNETSGAWHLYVKIELPKAPLTAHQSMKFLFTKTAEYERSLVDGHEGPVNNRTSLKDQQATVESLDVDFADPSGKVFKGTNFDFGLTRTRGYVAGEYKVEVHMSDGTNVGTSQNLTLKGDNEVVDRRAITFNANSKSIKKVDGVDAGGNVAQNDTTASNNVGNGEVTATGTGTPFISPDAYKETDEEKIKTRPKGCGCDVPGVPGSDYLLSMLPLAGLGIAALRRRKRA